MDSLSAKLKIHSIISLWFTRTSPGNIAIRKIAEIIQLFFFNTSKSYCYELLFDVNFVLKSKYAKTIYMRERGSHI